jgi:hypothetical protein
MLGMVLAIIGTSHRKLQNRLPYNVKEANVHKKGIFVVLVILFIVPGLMLAQDIEAKPQKTFQSGVRPGVAYPIDRGHMTVNVPKQDKARVVLLAASVWPYDAATDSEAMQHIFKQNVDAATIYVDFSAVLNTKVKFHVIFAGPEYFVYDEEEWLPAKYKSSDYFEDNVYWVSFIPSEWKKGTYKIVIIAEQETLGSGAESVFEFTFRII